MFNQYIEVVLSLPIDQSYTYIDTSASLQVGSLIEVPFRNRIERAVVIQKHSQPLVDIEIKEAGQLLIDDPVVTVDQIELAEWISNQYLCSVGEALFKMFPSPYNLSQKTKLELRKRGIETEQSRQNDSNWQMNIGQKLPNRDFELNNDQADILKIIETEISQHKSSIHLIHGITGSGKTEIYIRSIEKALAENKSSILLVPEISLTVQTIDRLQSVFGSELALLHSGRRPKDRFISYNNIIEGHCRVVVGTRSAVFAPVKNLGVIILDEEHDSSYRENSNPRYDARKIAEERCIRHSAVLVLGSATPRVELRYSAEKYDVRKNNNSKARFFYHRLSERAKGILAEVELIPQQNQVEISRNLLLAIEENFAAKNQTVLLLNRRGYQPYLVCRSCRSMLQCKNCSVAMTLHRDGRLLCHQCGFVYRSIPACLECGGSLKKEGAAVQKIEEYLSIRFPTMRIERLDTDAAAKVNVESVLQRFLNGEIDVLTGTQMIAKGLDSHRVTLVGVLQADRGLSFPDFRANERVFSLLMQVAGRAGRGESKGKVYFEALNINHPILQLAKTQNYEEFFAQEIEERKENGYPPFRRLVRLLIRSKQEEKANHFIEILAKLLTVYLADLDELLGPAPAPLTKLHNSYRYHIIIKTTSLQKWRTIFRKELPKFKALLTDKAYLELEFDPLDML